MGVSQILFGAIAQDGGMSQNLAAVGYTNQDSCSITMDDPDVTEFYAEEVDMPVITKSKKGKVNVALSIMNPSVETLAMFLGHGRTAQPTKILNYQCELFPTKASSSICRE